MDAPEDVDTFDGRLATFQRPHHFNKRRASAAAASSKKKAQPTTATTWPHERPDVEELARAGFYYKPSTAGSDSVTCYLCGKALDGWDPDDDPAIEHLSHVPDCGWAINVAIERRSQDMDRAEEDPLNEKMMESRRATFKGAWPHESKKGWKCKLEKMVAAGWCYAPLPEADDCVHCFYCGISLDGWEPKDEPWEEHRRRAPECHFFTLVEESAQTRNPPKKTTRVGRASRSSKASRASTQSTNDLTLNEPPLELDDSLAEDDDTILTTASTASKSAKGRKKATKAKTAPKRKQPARTDPVSAADDSVMSDADVSKVAPPAKARSTKTRKNNAADEAPSQEVDMSEAPPKKTRAPRKKKASAVPQTVTEVSEAVDSDQHLELDTTVMSATAPMQPPKKTRAKKQNQEASETFVVDSEAVISEPVTRKASKAKASKPQPAPDSHGGDDDHGPATADDTARPTRGKKRTSDGLEKVDSSVVSAPALPTKSKARAAGPKRDRAASRAKRPSAGLEQIIDSRPGIDVEVPVVIDQANESHPNMDRREDSPSNDHDGGASTVPEEENEEANAEQPPPTPPLDPSNLSPTASAQSSDAENHPPSSRPSSFGAAPEQPPNSSHHLLKTTTPLASPSKRVVAGGLISTAPWTPVDLEHVFLPSPSSRRVNHMEDKEAMTVEGVIQRLTSPEKKMTVEEWILWNATKAEERLKGECERLIGVFEGEGVKALQALEGIECA